MDVDAFIDVGHTFDHEGSIHLDLLDSKWGSCLLLETRVVVKTLTRTLSQLHNIDRFGGSSCGGGAL
jgi:hypothetical protein